MKNEVKVILKERKRIAVETQDEWDYGIERCRKKEIEILTRDLKQTIDFLENECTDDTFYWLGEVFEDVAESTRSREFVDAIKRRAKKIVNSEQKRSVETDIRYAEYRLDN